jgi:hypothetical protein
MSFITVSVTKKLGQWVFIIGRFSFKVETFRDYSQ